MLGTGTVVSCFPSQDAHYQQTGDKSIRDLYTTLRRRVGECDGVWDLHATIVEHATTHLHDQWNRRLIDYIEIYKWATSKKVGSHLPTNVESVDTNKHQTALQAMSFRNFYQSSSDGSAALEDQHDLELALEVADIIDELKMIKNLLEKQQIVVSSMRSGPKSSTTSSVKNKGAESIERAAHHLESVLSNLNEIKTEAEETYKSVCVSDKTLNHLRADSHLAARSARPQVQDCKLSRSTLDNKARPSSHALHCCHNHIRTSNIPFYDNDAYN